MTQSVVQGQENVFVRVKCVTDSTGVPATGIVAATAGHVISYQRLNEAVVTDATAAADASGLTAAHVDWEFDEIGGGMYQVAVPDAAWIAGAASCVVWMSATGISGVPAEITIDHLLKWYGIPSGVTATSLTLPAGPVLRQGDSLFVEQGTGAGQTRLVESVSGQVATVRTWDTQPSAVDSFVVLIPGDQILGDGGINCDAAISSRSSHTQGDVRNEIDAAVAAGVHVTEVNSVTVGGSGTIADPWGAA
jgi:hypothetical protein